MLSKPEVLLLLILRLVLREVILIFHINQGKVIRAFSHLKIMRMKMHSCCKEEKEMRRGACTATKWSQPTDLKLKDNLTILRSF